MAPRDPQFIPQPARPFRPPTISPEYRLYDLNKRLSMRNEDCDQHWWEMFAHQFFEDDATLILTIPLDDESKRFTVNRPLIARFFRTLFEGDIHEVYFQFKHSKEMVHHPIIVLDCEHGSMIMQVGKPSFIRSCTEGHFTIEFTFDDSMRIRTWHWTIKQHYEFIPRSVVAIPTDNPTYLEQLSRNFIRHGLTPSMINFLRLCEILQPMHELMSRQKGHGYSPRDCLKTMLQKPCTKTPTEVRPAKKPARKRKSNSSTVSGGTESPVSSAPTTPTKKRSSTNSLSNSNSTRDGNFTPGDVMIVGEPSLMGGEMDDEDERFITRLENSQFESNGSNQENPSKSTFVMNPSLIKREQMSYPVSPLPLPSMFNSNGQFNGERRISSTTNPSPLTINSNPNSSLNENKQEAHTPPVTPQQTSVIA